ncbi:hypothetical protein VNI00_015554 [Paramarasmius palmivorus]|uniref:Uncharacterized protein n=1 Tax=Paramarasmius palmivorus TaxID=297713 RepID=A0AAW0BKU6_9AGAR
MGRSKPGKSSGRRSSSATSSSSKGTTRAGKAKAVKRSHKAKSIISSLVVPARKRGRKSDWPDEELAFLTSKLSEYASIKGNRGPFWTKLYAEFLEKFPKYNCRLSPAPSKTSKKANENAVDASDKQPASNNSDKTSPSSQPPDSNSASASDVNASSSEKRPATDEGAVAEATTSSSCSTTPGQGEASVSVNGSEKLGEAADEQLEEVAIPPWPVTKEKVRNFFYNHKNDGSVATGWRQRMTEYFKPLRRPSRIPAFKFYMKLPEYANMVTAEFEERFLDGLDFDSVPNASEDGGEEDSEEEDSDLNENVQYYMDNWDEMGNGDKQKVLEVYGIAIRCIVARELFDAEPRKVRKTVEKKNEAAYKARLEEYEQRKASRASAASGAAEIQDQDLAPLATSLAEDLHEMTGMHVSIFIGKPPTKPGEKCIIDSMHAGTNRDGKKWADHDREKVRKATKYFFSFLETCSALEDDSTEPVGTSKKGKGKSRDDGGKKQDSVSRPTFNSVQFPITQPSTEFVATREGGPDRDPANPPQPRQRVAPKPISKPKKMSTRMKSRVVTTSDEEDDDDEADEREESEKNRTPGVSFLPSLQPEDPSCLFDDVDVNEHSPAVEDRAIPPAFDPSSPMPINDLPPQNNDETIPSPDTVNNAANFDAMDDTSAAFDPMNDASHVDDTNAGTGQFTIDDSSEPLTQRAVSNTAIEDRAKDSSNTVDGSQVPTEDPNPGMSIDEAMDVDDSHMAAATNDLGAVPVHFDLPSTITDAIARIPSGDVGEWLREAIGVLTTSESMVELEVWQLIVHELVSLESQYMYINNSRLRLPSPNRPDIYKRWFKEARTADIPEPFPPVEEFKADLWAWWNAINPAWRERMGDCRMSRSKDGDWAVLRCPGQNGLLLPLIGLCWWYLKDAIEGGSEEWKEFAEDILWVIEKVSSWEKANPQPPPPSQKPPPSRASQKRPASSSKPSSTQPISTSKPCSSQRLHSSTQPSSAYTSKPRSSQRLPSSTQPSTSSRPHSGRGTSRDTGFANKEDSAMSYTLLLDDHGWNVSNFVPTITFLQIIHPTITFLQIGGRSTGRRNQDNRPPSVPRLLRSGFKRIPWDVDREGRIIAVLCGRPYSPAYEEAAASAFQAIMDEGRVAPLGPQADAASRRGHFPAFNIGCAMGMGSSQPVALNNGVMAPTLAGLIGHHGIQRIAGYHNASFALWAPRLYQKYEEVCSRMYQHNPALPRNFADGVFTAATFNFGSNV